MYDDDQDALAAEYVLGTLSADEREQAEALLAIDPGFAETVRQWERRLGELNVMVEAVEPPPDVWDKIRAEIRGDEPGGAPVEALLPSIDEPAPQTAPETPEEPAQPVPEWMPELEKRLEPQDLDAVAPSDDSPEDADDSAAVDALASSLLPPDSEPPAEAPSLESPPSAPKTERSADVIYLARRVRRWRSLTLAAGAIAALLAIFIGVEQFAPDLIPLPRPSQTVVAARPQPPATRFVAVLQHDPTTPAFLLTLDAQTRTLTVRRVAAGAEADRSYELWLVSSKYQGPRSLGVVGGSEFTARPIPANIDADTVRGASYAISLEPVGGSKTGAPTGPILFTGKLVEAVPGSQPPG
jgi:anti-sigma-K factor RskA